MTSLHSQFMHIIHQLFELVFFLKQWDILYIMVQIRFRKSNSIYVAEEQSNCQLFMRNVNKLQGEMLLKKG